MLPSSTVENYLKAIYQGQSTLVGDERLVPMGQVAAALGVTPGTATTMVKALAESGLAEHDPHSDPIPNPEGTITPRNLDTLLTCPVGERLKVTRIADQDPEFLRFIENNDLKPGQAIEVEARDTAADAVNLRGKNDRAITI